MKQYVVTDDSLEMPAPFFEIRITAGFPSPAQDLRFIARSKVIPCFPKLMREIGSLSTGRPKRAGRDYLPQQPAFVHYKVDPSY